MNTWKTLSSKYVHENKYYKVREDLVERPDGTKGTYHVIESLGGVAVIVVDEANRILLQKVFRYPTQMESWELVLGGLEQGEDPLEAAKRELMEETGYQAADWIHLGRGQGWNSKSDSMGDAYVCKNLTRLRRVDNKREGQADVQVFSLSEIYTMIREQKITDYKTLAPLMMAVAAAAI